MVTVERVLLVSGLIFALAMLVANLYRGFGRERPKPLAVDRAMAGSLDDCDVTARSHV